MSIGVNLRVTGHCRQGGRKYMEDFFSVAYQQTEDEKDLEYAFFGIYDGHGGAEAAAFAKEHLMETIIKHKNFWSDDDQDVLRAIKDGYIATHYAMWKEQEKWPKTASGLPSTAGTTASIAFIRRGKIYIGHVGDSGIVLGYQEPHVPEWKARPLTRDHKPENLDEMARIQQCGGKVVAKSGVPRVVWNRPRIGHQGPVRRSTPIDEIPFLAVARSLGDLWSYNSRINQFVVSPDPDCSVITIDTSIHRCLVFGTDGLYNMLSPSMAVHIVQQAERHNENAALGEGTSKTWLNPSKLLVEKALERWHNTKMRADNTSVVTLMLDPPGPPRAQVLKNRKKNYPESGLKIMTRYEDQQQENNYGNKDEEVLSTATDASETRKEEACKETNVEDTENCCTKTPLCNNSNVESSSDITSNSLPLKERNFVPKARASTSFDPRESNPSFEKSNSNFENEKENKVQSPSKDEEIKDDSIQINEISSSSSDLFETTHEDEENVKHNLRSANKINKTGNVESKVEKSLFKRRGTDSGEEPLRKSVRLDTSKKKVENETNRQRKVASKLSLAQKILKSKKLALKKKNLVKKPIAKKKFALMLKGVKDRTNTLVMSRAVSDKRRKNPTGSDSNKSDFKKKKNLKTEEKFDKTNEKTTRTSRSESKITELRVGEEEAKTERGEVKTERRETLRSLRSSTGVSGSETKVSEAPTPKISKNAETKRGKSKGENDKRASISARSHSFNALVTIQARRSSTPRSCKSLQDVSKPVRPKSDTQKTVKAGQIVPPTKSLRQTIQQHTQKLRKRVSHSK